MSASMHRRMHLHALAAATCLALSGLATSAYGQAHLSSTAPSEESYDQFIVKYRADAPERADHRRRQQGLDRATTAIARAHGRALGLSHLRAMSLGADVIKADRKLQGKELKTLLRQLAADPNVEYAEVDVRLYPLVTPNDTRYSEQWGYTDADAGINVPTAWDTTTGSGVVVAVVDTGISPHSDLDANILAGYDFVSDSSAARDGNGRDSNPKDEGDWSGAGECGIGSTARNSSWHGTHVTGTVAAVTNNSKGVAGTAYGAKVVPVRVLAKCGGQLSDIADGVVWAAGGTVSGIPANANPAEVINMSLGGGGSCSTTYQNAITSAVNRGVSVVVAAGNSNNDASNNQPANCSNVITVGAVDSNGARSVWSSSQKSSYGSVVDVAAPGSNILSTLNSGTTTPSSESYASYGGTSMATPHVAGVVALIQAAVSTPKTPSEIETLLKNNTKPFPATPDQPIGRGIVDAKKTLDAALAGGGGGGSTVLQNGVARTGVSGAQGSNQFFTLDVPSGATGLKFVTSGGSGDADLYVKFGSQPSTTSYDCRSEGSTTAETCSISTAQVGTYHVLLYGYSAYSGTSLTGSYSTGGGGGGSQTYTNGNDYTINDNSTVDSPIAVSGRSGNAPSNASVSVNIVHTYRGDLRVQVVAPDGSTYLLKDYNGSDSADNVNATYQANLSSEALNGTWKLRVTDNADNDVGYINSWSVTF